MNPRLGITPNAAQKEFANRYIYGKRYLSETWAAYCARYGFSPYAGDLGKGEEQKTKLSEAEGTFFRFFP
jgi:hypothetical protein